MCREVLTGTYAAFTDSRLISPTLTLAAISDSEELHLRFWQWFAYGASDAGYIRLPYEMWSRGSGRPGLPWVNLSRIARRYGHVGMRRLAWWPYRGM